MKEENLVCVCNLNYLFEVLRPISLRHGLALIINGLSFFKTNLGLSYFYFCVNYEFFVVVCFVR